MQPPGPAQGRIARIAEKAAAAVAAAGGLLVLTVAALVALSVLGRSLFNYPIPADFEFVEIGTGIAVFAFLSYTQLRHGHIAVDIFTTRWPGRVNAAIDGIWNLALAAFLAFFAWGLFSGAAEAWQYGETLVQISWPLWPVYAACAVLAGVASIAGIVVALLKFRALA